MKGLVLGGGAAILIGAAIAYALSQGQREAAAVEAPAPEVAAAPEPVELADPGVVEEPAEEPATVTEPGYVVDPDGFVWEPLSFHKPQVKNNGDGTLTMKKLARIYNPADGTFRETPITATATPDQRRLPVKRRDLPPHAQKKVDPDEAAQEAAPAEEAAPQNP